MRDADPKDPSDRPNPFDDPSVLACGSKETAGREDPERWADAGREGSAATLLLVVVGLLGGGCTAPDEGFSWGGDQNEAPAAPATMPLYADLTADSGLSHTSPEPTSDAELSVDWIAGGGTAVTDLTGDGLLDVVLTAPFGEDRLFVGMGDGSFDELPDALPAGERTRSVAAADLDGDGDRDLLVGDGPLLRHLRNRGDGIFDELDPVLSLPADHAVVGVALADVDGDGVVDAYVSVYGSAPTGQLPAAASDRFLHGVPGGSFEDRTDRFGPSDALTGMTFAATWLDVDDDGDLDLYAVRDKGAMLGRNALFVQEGEGWTDRAADWALDAAVDGMGVALGDVDGDGRTELAFSDIEDRLHLYSLDEGAALDRSVGWDVDASQDDQVDSWGLAFADLDHDGFDDLLVPHGGITAREANEEQGTALLRWSGTRFEDRSAFLPDVPTRYGRNVVAADVDGDGGLELLITCAFGEPALFTAEPPTGAWLEVAADGPPGNSEGLGAKVLVEDSSGTRSRWLTVGGSGVHSSSQAGARFGLGAADSVDVSVQWPDGSVSERLGVAVDQRIVVRWGE